MIICPNCGVEIEEKEMPSPCKKCKHYNTPYCTQPCDTFKAWRANPEAFERAEESKKEPERLAKEILPHGVVWVELFLSRDNVCMQDCMDLSRYIKVRSDRKMADIDDELRRTWLPKGYTWVGGCRSGTAGEYVGVQNHFHTGSLRYNLKRN